MANICEYTMCVKGTKENVKEFLLRMTREYEEGKHFFRIFECDTEYEHETSDGLYFAKLSGFCAWSIAACMRKTEMSYYSISNDPNKSCIEDTCIELNLEWEVISKEPGMGFEEFVHIKGSEILRDECVEYRDDYFEMEN